MRLMRARALALLALAFPALGATDWKLVWSDEFNGPANALPDSNKWTYDLGGGGWGNQELEVYTRDPGNVSQDGEGHLIIRAVKTTLGQYTSARIKTESKFAIEQGKIAVRMKIPRGQGMWPAFWMLGANHKAGWRILEV